MISNYTVNCVTLIDIPSSSSLDYWTFWTPWCVWEDADEDWEAPVEVDAACEGVAEEVPIDAACKGPAEKVSQSWAEEWDFFSCLSSYNALTSSNEDCVPSSMAIPRQSLAKRGS
jgi:hypothetical protein